MFMNFANNPVQNKAVINGKISVLLQCCILTVLHCCSVALLHCLGCYIVAVLHYCIDCVLRRYCLIASSCCCFHCIALNTTAISLFCFLESVCCLPLFLLFLENSRNVFTHCWGIMEERWIGFEADGMRFVHWCRRGLSLVHETPASGARGGALLWCSAQASRAKSAPGPTE